MIPTLKELTDVDKEADRTPGAVDNRYDRTIRTAVGPPKICKYVPSTILFEERNVFIGRHFRCSLLHKI